MRTIKFRAWDKTSNRMMDWLHLQTDNEFRDFQFLLFESDQFIFLQFTGLLDKNGKEIYEGDIVRNFEMQLAHHTIEWVIDGFSLNYHNDTHGVIHPSLLEIIGNIYEQP